MNETMKYSGPDTYADIDQSVPPSRILSLTEQAHKLVFSFEHILGPVLVQLSEKSSQSKEINESEAVAALQSLCNKLAELQARIRL